MITAITFDVWGTLIHDTPHLEATRAQARLRGMAEALNQAGAGVSVAALEAAYVNSRRRLDAVWARCLDVDTLDQVLDLLRDIDPALAERLSGPSLSRVLDAYVLPFFDVPPLLASGAWETLQQVNRRGHKVGLICNTGRTPGWAVRQLLDTYGILGQFRSLAFSNEEGVRKPHAMIFRRVLERLEVAPAATVHVGDDPVADICGAKSAGLKAVCIGQHRPQQMFTAPDACISSLPELMAALDQLAR